MFLFIFILDLFLFIGPKPNKANWAFSFDSKQAHWSPNRRPNSKLPRTQTGWPNTSWLFSHVKLDRSHARNVKASEVQGYISDSHTVCSDTDTSLGYSCLLGIWRHASQSLKCLFSSPKNSLQRHGCRFNAHPPGMPVKSIIRSIHTYNNKCSF